MYFPIMNLTNHDRFNELSRCWTPVQQVVQRSSAASR